MKLPADREVPVDEGNRDDVHGYVALKYAEPHELGPNLQRCRHEHTADVVEDEAVAKGKVLKKPSTWSFLWLVTMTVASQVFREPS